MARTIISKPTLFVDDTSYTAMRPRDTTTARPYVNGIAVRAPKSSLPDLFSDPRISVHKGALGDESLGLELGTAAAIFGEADLVIHNVADVFFLKTYATLHPTNVPSTQRLAQLAAPRLVPVHYVSSASVAQLSRLDEFGEVSTAAFPPPRDARELTGGYTAAKWASERFLENAAAQ
ncbi:hypothetical protein DL764_004101 [Monosporascus ibericus]|uniref:Thioester reductase (TE) domain-containing protein n=1 Tax=Monosporascus ibericus TaxID=155417 RepID=A0A4Q4TE27_9PEZI|nr:hypothetical protein DL764_004101 [Monosporascus ibericus]